MLLLARRVGLGVQTNLTPDRSPKGRCQVGVRPRVSVRSPVRPVASGAVTAPIIAGAEPWSARRRIARRARPPRVHRQPPVHATAGRGLAAAGFSVDLPLLPGHGTSWRTCSPPGGRTGPPAPRPPTRPWPTGATRWWSPDCRWAARWPAGWPSSTPRSPASPWSTRSSRHPTRSSGRRSGGLLDGGTEVFDAIGSDIARRGGRGRPTPAPRWPPSSPCSRGRTGSGPGLGEIHCPTLLL